MNKQIKISLVASILASTLGANDDFASATVYSATKTDQSIQDVTSNIEIITSLELEEKHYTTVAQALNSIAGITVSQSGGIGQQTSFFLRGFDTESTLVLVNGVEFNNPTTTGGQAQLEHLAIADIDRIEIIKGAQSGIYGANAVAGVINIITKKATKDLRINSSIELGAFNTKKIQISASQKIDKLSFYFGYTKNTTDGFTSQATKDENIEQYEDDSYSNQTLNANISYDISEKDILEIKYTDIDAKVDYDYSISNQDGHTISEKEQILNTSFTHKYSSNSYSKLFYTKAKFLKEDPTGWTKKFEGQNQELGIDTKIDFNNNKAFLFVGANKKESKDIVNNRIIDTNGLYITTSNKVDKTILTATLREDKYNKFQDKTTGKLGVKYTLNNDTSLSSNYATAYKIPSLYEYNGNSNLTPESIKSFDLQLNYKNSKITYFTNDITDEILYPSTTWSYYNSTKTATIKGIEFNYQNEILEDMLLNFNYTKFDAKDEDGYQLAKRPDSIINLGLDYYGLANHHFNLNAQYIGDRVEYDWGTHDISAQTGNYTVFNSVVNYDFHNNLKVYFKIDNLTNKYYQTIDGYATSPRAYYVGLNYSF